MKPLRFLFILIFLSICATMSAQIDRTDTLSVEIPFRRASATLDMGYNSTAEVLGGFIRSLESLNGNPDIIIHSINILSAASVEGSREFNDRLSLARARTILGYLTENTSLSPSQIKINSRGENWEDLMKAVQRCSEEWKPQALEIIRTVLENPSEAVSDSCKQQLRALADGRAWQWMQEEVFPSLRSAGGSVLVITSTVRQVRDTLVILHQHVTSSRDTVFFETVPVEKATAKRPFRNDSLYRVPVVALRTNLLLPLLNVGVEVPLSNRFSLGADILYPWVRRPWMNHFFPDQMYCTQAVSGTLEARWWLGHAHSERSEDRRYRLRGHSLGVVATGGYYDLESDWKGQQGEFLALGLDYMYALPLGRGDVHFEFGLGLGYAVNRYRNYDVRYEGGRLIGNGRKAVRHSPVPVRARFALVIPLHKRTSHE